MAAVTIDLVTLDQVKSWLNIPATTTVDDGTIQFLITGFSDYVMWKCGVDSFNSVNSYVEIYDGNGASRMFLRNTPIVSLVSVQAGVLQLPQSTGLAAAGLYVERSRKSIAFRSIGSPVYGSAAGRSFSSYIFPPGQGNIQVSYTAGYTAVPPSLIEATIKAVAINYKRKDWIDLASKNLVTSQGGSGTTRYRDWALPPEIRDVLAFYSRQAIV